jgi:predicted RNase H-like HicB family nuclease
VDEVTQNMREAIEAHLELLAESGDPIPEPLDVVGTATIRIAS